MEELIRDTPGVSSVRIDIKSNKLFMVLSGDATSAEEIETVLRNSGYIANGKKNLTGTNICKYKIGGKEYHLQ